MSQDTALECPSCGKRGFIRLQDESEIFECVYCKHRTNLAQRNPPMGWLSAALVAILIGFLLVAG
ncbi:MAG: hypothetical protein AAFW84_24835 [Cyanobacteria bacterium J06635_15]